MCTGVCVDRCVYRPLVYFYVYFILEEISDRHKGTIMLVCQAGEVLPHKFTTA